MKELGKGPKGVCKATLLKKVALSRKAIASLCSYGVKAASPRLTISQQETGFSLDLRLEKMGELLQVTQFSLTDQPLLRAASEELYDAVLVEIVLQGLVGLTQYATKRNLPKILFLLEEEEAIHLLGFEDFFTDFSTVITPHGKRVSFTLDCALKAIHFKKIDALKTQIRHHLWRGQRHDLYLRNYLQTHPKGTSLIFKAPPQPELPDNLLLFPIRFQD